ncbi:MAG: glycosyltransferase family 4 protein [Leptospirales bacterium]|nr:glycosyltransferase family 4 protein [Leptospirales bacterium]
MIRFKKQTPHADTTTVKAPTRVLFDARMLGHSGIGVQVYNVLRQLITLDQVRLRLLGDPQVIRRLLPEYDGPIIPFTAPIYSLREQLNFPTPAPGELIHAPHYNAPILRLRRTVVVVHDLIHLQSQEFAGVHYRFYAWLLLWLVSRFSLHIVTVSEFTLIELRRRFPSAAGRSSVVHNGLDHRIFRPAARAAVQRFRKQHSLPASYLLCVGIAKRHKNVDFAVRSLAKFWRDGSLRAPLCIGGAGGRLPDYVACEAQRLGVESMVRPMPFLEDRELALLYAGADLFLMPSLLEGFGFPLVEAMACGAPTMAANRASLPELALNSTLYFDPTDEESFQKVFWKLYRDRALRRKLSAAAKKVTMRFDWRKHAAELLAIYRQTTSD